jgi:UDP-N-acetylglucosamine:LPS N-acetylglucosamine transferase
MGLPTLVLILAANQQSGAMALQAYGAAWVAADAQQLMAQMTALFNKETQTSALQKMSQAATKLATGNGASQVVELLLEPHV